MVQLKQSGFWLILIDGELDLRFAWWSLTFVMSTSIAAVPSFPGLRRFPEGRGFKQWTGDDSKALMKVRSD